MLSKNTRKMLKLNGFNIRVNPFSVQSESIHYRPFYFQWSNFNNMFFFLQLFSSSGSNNINDPIFLTISALARLNIAHGNVIWLFYIIWVRLNPDETMELDCKDIKVSDFISAKAQKFSKSFFFCLFFCFFSSFLAPLLMNAYSCGILMKRFFVPYFIWFFFVE